MPAPAWLHQLPAWIRRSTRDWLTNVFTSVDVLGAVGRAAPPAAHGRAAVAVQLPQPLREVSISMPMFELKPDWTNRLRKAWANVSSSTYTFQSTHLAWRTEVPLTEVLMVKYGSVSA